MSNRAGTVARALVLFPLVRAWPLSSRVVLQQTSSCSSSSSCISAETPCLELSSPRTLLPCGWNYMHTVRGLQGLAKTRPGQEACVIQSPWALVLACAYSPQSSSCPGCIKRPSRKTDSGTWLWLPCSGSDLLQPRCMSLQMFQTMLSSGSTTILTRLH